MRAWSGNGNRQGLVVGLQPTVIASRAPHLLLDSKNRGRASPVKGLGPIPDSATRFSVVVRLRQSGANVDSIKLAIFDIVAQFYPTHRTRARGSKLTLL